MAAWACQVARGSSSAVSVAALEALGELANGGVTAGPHLAQHVAGGLLDGVGDLGRAARQGRICCSNPGSSALMLRSMGMLGLARARAVVVRRHALSTPTVHMSATVLTHVPDGARPPNAACRNGVTRWPLSGERAERSAHQGLFAAADLSATGHVQRPFLAAARFAGLSLAARRASRYFLMVAFATSLCLAQTIPNTGAAGLLQPGTGHSCLGRRRTGVAPRKAAAANLGGRPRRRGSAPPPTAAMTICRARLVASASTAETNRPTKSSTSERMLDSGAADVLAICDPTGESFLSLAK